MTHSQAVTKRAHGIAWRTAARAATGAWQLIPHRTPTAATIGTILRALRSI